MHAKEQLIQDGESNVPTKQYIADLKHNSEATDILRNHDKDTNISKEQTVKPKLPVEKLSYSPGKFNSNSKNIAEKYKPSSSVAKLIAGRTSPNLSKHRVSRDLAGKNITDTTDGYDNDGVRRRTPRLNGSTSTVSDNVNVAEHGESVPQQVTVPVRKRRSDKCPASPPGQVSNY